MLSSFQPTLHAACRGIPLPQIRNLPIILGMKTKLLCRLCLASLSSFRPICSTVPFLLYAPATWVSRGPKCTRSPPLRPDLVNCPSFRPQMKYLLPRETFPDQPHLPFLLFNTMYFHFKAILTIIITSTVSIYQKTLPTLSGTAFHFFQVPGIGFNKKTVSH